MALRSAWWMPTANPHPPQQVSAVVPTEIHKRWPWSTGTTGIAFHVLETFLKSHPGQRCLVDKFVFVQGASFRKNPLWCHAKEANSVPILIKLLKQPDADNIKSKIYLVSEICGEAVQALGHYLEVTPRFFSLPDAMLSTGDTVADYVFFAIQLMEKYSLGTVPGEMGRTRTPYSVRFRTNTTQDGLALHEWHITRIALTFLKDKEGRNFRGIIQLDPADKVICDGLKILMTRDEETFSGGLEDKGGLGQILAEVFYVIQFTWGAFLAEAESHLQTLSSKCVEEDLSSNDQLKYTRELHQTAPLWVQVRRRILCAQNAAEQMIKHPFFTSMQAQGSFENYLRKTISAFEAQIVRSTELKDQTNVLISLIFNIATLQDTQAAVKESKAANEFAASIRRVTFLTFIYLPLALAAAIFGMNVGDITGDSRQPKIGNYILLSISLMVATFAAWLFWSRFHLVLWLKTANSRWKSLPPPRTQGDEYI